MRHCWVLSLVFFCCVAAGAQEKPGVAPVIKLLNAYLGGIEGEAVPLAEAMPADKYDFAPTDGEFRGVRTFAQQLNHLASDNYAAGSAILRQKSPVPVDSKGVFTNPPKTKDEIIKLLKDSFAYAHKAFQTINDQNAYTDVQSPWDPNRKISNVNMAINLVAHPWDHYGQMVVYLRMNQIIPPASRPKEKK